MNHIVQINETIVQSSSVLQEKDIGKWCILIDGCYNGFWETKAEAEYCFYSYFVK